MTNRKLTTGFSMSYR